MIPCIERKLPYLIPLPAKFVSFAKDKGVKKVLEVGCGYGRACFFLLENHLSVTGVDVDKVQIRSAIQESKTRGISGETVFVVDDARDLCFRDSSFDAVTMLGVLTLMQKSDRPRIMSEVTRVLKLSGYVFIEEFGRTWRNPVYAKRYRDDLRVTGEMGTITVRDEAGRILHLGHHFTREELVGLLEGFSIINLEEDTFTSYYHRNWVNGYKILAQKSTDR
jgi:ubiquinone/menaquinone biosynthesis C-methylase UbiE